MLFATISKDEREFIGELYDTYYPFWYKTAFEMVRDEETAKDMINETFLKFIKSKRNFTEFDKNALLAFVLKSIRNTCLTYITKVSKTKTNCLDDEILQNIADEISVEDKCIKNIDIEKLKTVLGKLDDKEQLFIVLHYYEELNDREIASEMNMKYDNIRMYRSRLIVKIRKLFTSESKVSRNEQS